MSDGSFFEKLREWAQALALVVIPIMVAIMGNKVATSNTSRETDARMVDIATRVLSGPANDSTHALRTWAVKVINRFSKVPLDTLAQASLVRYDVWDLDRTPAIACDSAGFCRVVVHYAPYEKSRGPKYRRP